MSPVALFLVLLLSISFDPIISTDQIPENSSSENNSISTSQNSSSSSINKNSSHEIGAHWNLSDYDNVSINDTILSIDIIRTDEIDDAQSADEIKNVVDNAVADVDVDESEEEERRQALEGGALNFCEEPPPLDQFLYLFIFTDQCYAYAGHGPRWSAMTGYSFDADEHGGISKSRSKKSATDNSTTTTTIYSCGNGKKLPPFTPLVHILNASWFLHASTSSKEEKSKEKSTAQNGTSDRNETDGSNNETSTGANETARSTAIEKGKGGAAAKSEEKPPPNPDEDWCMMVNFYSPSCPFSARLAPFYNALPRVFPKLLYIAAVDATESSRLNLIYGVAGTPTVMLFHNGKPVARLDDGEYALQRLVSFVTQRTDLKPHLSVDVENEDLQGPLPGVPIRTVDYYLVLAWIFLLSCAAFYGARSSTAQRVWETMCRNWREMEEEQEDLNHQAAG